jgi:hypothetical protein
VQKRARKVIAEQGELEVGFFSSGERQTLETAVCCVSAAGYYVPPILIFKRESR